MLIAKYTTLRQDGKWNLYS